METTFHELWLCQVKLGLITLDSYLDIFDFFLDYNPMDIHLKSVNQIIFFCTFNVVDFVLNLEQEVLSRVMAYSGHDEICHLQVNAAYVQLVLLVYKVIAVFNKVNAAKSRVTTAVRVSTAGWIKWLEDQDMRVNEIY
nr:hypothetical protein [Tanacetum cinerariifolium]